MINQIEQFKRELNLSDFTKKYLSERFLNNDIIDKFNIGFCPACSNYNFDLLNGRLIVPIYDVYGNCIAFSGRKLDYYSTSVKNFYQSRLSELQGLEKFLKWKSAKWINTTYKKGDNLFNLNNAKYSIFKRKLCIIVEGYFDAIYFNKIGHPNVVALCGTSLTDRQCELIFRYCNQIVLVLDGDAAGSAATVKAVAKARNKNLFANVIELPNGKDPDNIDKKIFDEVINEITNSEEEVYIKL